MTLATWAIVALGVCALPHPAAAQRSPPARTTGSACGTHCGTERWLVKTLSDADAARIDARPVDITIEDLVQLVRPARLSETRRARPVEFTVYRVEARLLGMFGESDHDYHLVLASLNDSAITMIAEVPDPACSGSCASGRADIYAQVRQALMDHLNSPRIGARPRIRLTGVGFFDRLHGQRGVAPNGIELHPILSVQFCDQVLLTKAQWEQVRP